MLPFRPRLLSAALACLALLASPVAGAAQVSAAAPLTDADFLVAGFQMDEDSAEVRARLGAPDSVAAYDNPFDGGAQIAEWFYPGLEITYAYRGLMVGVALVSSEYATRRGLRVGEAVDRVRALYGEPDHVYETSWTYADPKDMEGMHVIRIEVVDGRVEEIYVGYLLD